MKKRRLFTLYLLASVIATSAVADSDVVLPRGAGDIS